MGVVVSVNVGLSRDVGWQGMLVRTAIWKRPVQKSVFAARLNLTGDAQAIDLRWPHPGMDAAIRPKSLRASASARDA
jgi:hypothetical protein